MTNWFGDIRAFHFVGVGGIGMSAIAELLLRQGFQVSGSDQRPGPLLDRLQELGGRIEIGHRVSNLGKTQAVIYSSAIDPDNPELKAARKQELPLIHRAEMLAELMRFKKGITISGTHGKTTTTAMLAVILKDAGLDPTAVVGARVPSLGSNARAGEGEYFVAEADESDRSFLRFQPVYTLVTNIDSDHMDEYRDLNDLEGTFLQHMNAVPFYGKVVVCTDDPTLKRLVRKVHPPVITYGLNRGAEFSADQIEHSGFQTCYELLHKGKGVGKIRLQLAGRHNVLNSVGAVSLVLALDIPFETIGKSLERFTGTERRLEWKGEKHNIWVLDDYAHHPAEITASLEACVQLQRRILLVFQPHRYSRTQHLMNELAASFTPAARLYLLDIYSAGEKAIEGVSSQRLAEMISARQQVTYVSSFDDLLALLKKDSQPGDLIVTMGAGDVWKIGEAFLEEEVN
jgi:UDP-N-acetylmuramate--alanine ligase